ncbi:hypothetical protein BSL78_16456 [Apostichopus japonicus]|uniref:Uncharacterized protein n=1 Tax=Stichopus japonicus TaxID=307972 RepID=A0A2G8KF93_STIJA|nr:hypothetical protein BSL78_16456 [Apostichopus japonicus]
MTSTDSFLCQPPRTGLNGLSQEDSVRLLKDIVYSSKRKYVEYPPPFKTEESSEESSKEAGEEQQGDELIKAVEAVQVKTEGEPLEAVEAVQVKSEGEPLEAVEAVQVKTEGEPPEDAVAEPEMTSGKDEATDQDSTPTAEPTVSTEGLSVEKDTYWKHRLQSMVMSNKRAGRQAAAERRGPEVKIPKEDLKECVDLGYSSTRIADKFSTSKHNVRRHLDMYKLGKARRFEILTDETIDEIVTSVIREHGVLKRRDVYDKIKESGLQIRKDDIRKSLCRLHPKGLHRGDPSILKKSWDAVQKQESDVAFLMQEHRAIVDGNEEDVIVLDTDELAKLMNHEGGIVLVDEHGNIMGGQGDVEEYHHHQQQQQQHEQEQQQQTHCTIETGHVENGMVVLQHQEGVVVTAGVDTEQDGTLLSNQEQHNPSDVAAVVASDEAPYQHPGTVAEGQEMSKEESLERTQHYHLTQTTNNESSLTIANQEHAPENSVAPVGEAAEETTPQGDAGNDGTSEVGQTPQETPPAVESHVVEASGASQAIPTSEESQISAIILEFNVPQGQESGQGVAHTSQEGQFATTQETSQEVYFVQGEQQSEEVRSLVVVNDSQETEEDAKDSVGKEEHIIMQLTEPASVPEGDTQQGVSLTSLNTVRPNQLSAQVLLELDRIAQNLQSHEVQGEPAPAVSTQGQ